MAIQQTIKVLVTDVRDTVTEHVFTDLQMARDEYLEQVQIAENEDTENNLAPTHKVSIVLVLDETTI